MAYELKEIQTAHALISRLLKKGELKDSDESQLYKAFVESENIRSIVQSFAEEGLISIECYKDTIYLIPKAENTTIGFSKEKLRKVMWKGDATTKDYRLAQFAVLVLLVEFYDGQGSDSKTRELLLVGDYQNAISKYLSMGAKNYSEGEQDMYGAAYSEMSQTYEALKSDPGRHTKDTKEGFVGSILNFLQNQGLVRYVEKDGMILTTEKLDRFIDYDLLNKENYQRWTDIIRKAEYEQN